MPDGSWGKKPKYDVRKGSDGMWRAYYMGYPMHEDGVSKGVARLRAKHFEQGIISQDRSLK